MRLNGNPETLDLNSNLLFTIGMHFHDNLYLVIFSAILLFVITLKGLRALCTLSLYGLRLNHAIIERHYLQYLVRLNAVQQLYWLCLIKDEEVLDPDLNVISVVFELCHLDDHVLEH